MQTRALCRTSITKDENGKYDVLLQSFGFHTPEQARRFHDFILDHLKEEYGLRTEAGVSN